MSRAWQNCLRDCDNNVSRFQRVLELPLFFKISTNKLLPNNNFFAIQLDLTVFRTPSQWVGEYPSFHPSVSCCTSKFCPCFA
ncbi:hypothetical protein THIOM_002727 [Candidatus Thiomargarita nelsonii]|uniref:Uncharacterized protein n=1 Tax=Candidatus Thiomargarita nelsonii TaxID=1003181 RepID=A0A176S0A1_9GAMM|nr:hypothetical protein THIOM_002727 [Candidatus Thiomargarita nelsonii]